MIESFYSKVTNMHGFKIINSIKHLILEFFFLSIFKFYFAQYI